MRRLTAIVAALALVLVLPAGASAAPPLNDLPAGATAVPSTLPQTLSQDTSQATVTTDDVGCGAGGQDQATVWYTFTPAADTRLLVDASASAYRVGINVFEGTASVETNIGCLEQLGVFDLAGGTTYLVMFADIDGEAPEGGALSVLFDVGPPAIDVTVTVDRVGKVQQKAGIAVVSGTISCSEEAEFGFIELNLQQRIGKYVLRGFGGADTTCGPEPVAWSSEITAENGRFGGGKATLDVFAAGCDPLQCGEFEQTFNVRLRR